MYFVEVLRGNKMKKPTPKEIGKCLKQHRTANNTTQDDICAKLNCSKTQISNVENGDHYISMSTFLGYCQVLDITPNELLNISTTNDKILPELTKELSNMTKKQQEQVLRIIKVL